MNDSTKKMLTEELLKECWHITGGGVSDDLTYFRCSICGKWLHFADIEMGCQRTFDNRDDMIELYQAIHKDGKWSEFTDYLLDTYRSAGHGSDYIREFYPWLFCLDGLDYDARCQMVAEWWEERKG